MSDEILSPYGDNRRQMIAGTDVPAVDGMRGQGDAPAFSQSRNSLGNREINASDKADLMAQISAIRHHSNTDQRMEKDAGMQRDAQERWASFKNAFASNDLQPMQVIGEVMSDEIWLTLGREGFSSKILATQNIQKGADGRVRVRKKDVLSFKITSDVKVQEQRIRQSYIYPPEFYIACYILIEDKEIAQSSADLLDEKFQDGLEAQLVREDNITRALLERSITAFNDVVFYTTFNPTVFTTIRTQVNRWGNQAQTMLLAYDVWDDIIADPDFVNWWDPVTKHELVLEGHLGRLLGVELITDGLRYPTLQVLQPGEIYMAGSPVTVGTKVIRTELTSHAIDTYNQGRPARGWFFQQTQGQIIGNGRATSGAKRL